jgi:hypothetical protein
LHTHYWYIGTDLVGTCKTCGETKDFGYLQRNVDPYLSKFQIDSPNLIKGKYSIKRLGDISIRYNDNFPPKMNSNIYRRNANIIDYD